jgi:RNase P protein component
MPLGAASRTPGLPSKLPSVLLTHQSSWVAKGRRAEGENPELGAPLGRVGNTAVKRRFYQRRYRSSYRNLSSSSILIWDGGH